MKIFLIVILTLTFIVSFNSEAVNLNIRDVLSTPMTAEECMAYNVYHEARSEPEVGQYMVMATVVNRAKRNWRGAKNECEVIKSPRQFSWTHDGVTDAIDVKDYKEFYQILHRVDFFYLNMEDYLVLSRGVDHYHADYVNPSWQSSELLEKKFKVGYHIFYKHK